MPAAFPDGIINCPRCVRLWRGAPMRKLAHPAGVTLDVCDRCGGMWVDGDEVQALFGKAKAGKTTGAKASTTRRNPRAKKQGLSRD
ncbi:hypothetical protein AUJ68_01775 [Candidatus Woesearchaeota archaeon CG1_02_57_44]|nr:MAG: hypothetical protein AUJ68_01775 [Candidatus Woesearchaeota archaeon CG1_02_57_44]